MAAGYEDLKRRYEVLERQQLQANSPQFGQSAVGQMLGSLMPGSSLVWSGNACTTTCPTIPQTWGEEPKKRSFYEELRSEIDRWLELKVA